VGHNDVTELLRKARKDDVWRNQS